MTLHHRASAGDQIGIYYWVKERFSGDQKRVLARHQGRGNFVFCDGHVSEMKLEGLFTRVDEAHAHLWNRDNGAHLERLGTNPPGP